MTKRPAVKVFDMYERGTNELRDKLIPVIQNEKQQSEVEELKMYHYAKEVRSASLITHELDDVTPIHGDQVLDSFLRVAELMGMETPVNNKLMRVANEMKFVRQHLDELSPRISLLVAMETELQRDWIPVPYQTDPRIEFFRVVNCNLDLLSIETIKEMHRIVDKHDAKNKEN